MPKKWDTEPIAPNRSRLLFTLLYTILECGDNILMWITAPASDSRAIAFNTTSPLNAGFAPANTGPGSLLSDSLPVPGMLSGSSAPGTAIAFIDSSLSEAQTLMAGLQPGTAVYALGTGDGIAQITQVLSGYSDVSSIAIFSHGGDGVLQLGSTSLNTANLMDYAGLLQSWSNSLSAGCRSVALRL